MTAQQQRARKILVTWNQEDRVKLRSVIEESIEQPGSAHAQELAEALEAVVALLRHWLRAPEQLPPAELRAALGLLRHLAGAI
jgi:hypothetical protein